ncbi:MAG TPA: hypothetical protein VFN10_22235 [Thermoanaerobaculia bacterium]|nr:hypothetical protein [Thermoanaerobaculia bacterium]
MPSEPLTSDFVLDDLRRFVAAKGFFLSPKLEEVLVHAERLAEELKRDPYAPVFVAALLSRSPRFRMAVRQLGGDPDEGARVIREDLDSYPADEPYSDGVFYSSVEDRDLYERTILIDRAMENASVADRHEILDGDFAKALLDHQLKLLRKDGGGGNWSDVALQSPYLMLAHVANTFDESLAVNVRDIERALRPEWADYSIGPVPEALREPVSALLDEHREPHKLGFVMMEFARTMLHQEIYAAIRNTLASFGLTAVRADEKMYADQLSANVKTYMHASRFGIAVFERLTHENHNANVTYELGYMQALGKPVGLLKDSTVPRLATDLAGEIYLPFDVQNPRETIYEQLQKWLADRRIIAPA